MVVRVLIKYTSMDSSSTTKCTYWIVLLPRGDVGWGRGVGTWGGDVGWGVGGLVHWVAQSSHSVGSLVFYQQCL